MSWLAIALCLLTVASAVADHILRKRHERFMSAERERWIASNDELMRALERRAHITQDRAWPSERGRA